MGRDGITDPTVPDAAVVTRSVIGTIGWVALLASILFVMLVPISLITHDADVPRWLRDLAGIGWVICFALGAVSWLVAGGVFLAGWIVTRSAWPLGAGLVCWIIEAIAVAALVGPLLEAFGGLRMH